MQHGRTTPPIVVPGLSTSSSTSSSPTSPASSSQDTVNPTEYPASTRSESTSGIEGVREDPSRDLLGMETRVHGESCVWQCSRTQGRTCEFFSWIIFTDASKRGIWQAQYLYSLPERPKLRHLLGTKITRAPCRKRTGAVVHRAENAGD